MAKFRKDNQENSVKQTCSSQNRSVKTSQAGSQGFRPLHQIQGCSENLGRSSNPLTLQSANNLQKKVITPQIIKHNYRSYQQKENQAPSLKSDETVENELVVRFVDAIDHEIIAQANEQEQQRRQSNPMQASISNFAFQTPNPNYYQTLGKFKLLRTGGTTGGQSTPNDGHMGLLSTMVGTTMTNQAPLLLMPDSVDFEIPSESHFN